MENIVKVTHKSYGIVINTTPPLLEPKEEELWTKDPRLREARKQSQGSQHFINNIIKCYLENFKEMKANLHLTVGKQRL